MRVILSGGGSGGHIFPAIAVAEGLKALDPGGSLLYIGATTGMEMRIVPETGIAFKAVTARKVRKLMSPGTIGAGLSLLKGYREARAAIRAFRAEAVVSTGGYVAAAAAFAGVRLGLPTILIAPDFIPGRTNRMVARFAKRVCIVFPETAPSFPPGRTVVTGLPLRAGIVAPPDITPSMARRHFPGLAPDRFTVLIIGGSQGARAVNELIADAAPALAAGGVQLLHQTGPNNLDMAMQRVAQLTGGDGGNDVRWVAAGFFDTEEMPLAYRAADLIVCRGGISTISEALAAALPSIVIPLPTSYADHQTANARAIERAGAGVHLAERTLTARALGDEALGLRAAPQRLATMAEACRNIGRTDASRAVAEIVLNGGNINGNIDKNIKTNHQ